MSFKKKIGLGVASAVLGISLVGGGTFAYFNDVETTENTFASGTLDLTVDPSTIIDVENIKPGDKMNRHFELVNDGSLDISEVLLTTDYSVNDDNGDADFGDHIRVNFLKNADKNGLIQDPENVITSAYLSDLKGEMPDAVKNQIEAWFGWGDEDSGLKSGDTDDLYVQFEFVDNGEDQNVFQGDSLELEWSFDAKQTDGELK
ncbi:TasA family protein [Lentibacillus sp. CBA3610]|uniref:TasA family protein n=1 Tax=Lentibacillus sp. CBA3610 TaxID=2518176 RepID=UPI001595A8C4|nr:TasA family protein [Lentibacillus sp. CBA3610]QKY68982.1 cell division protein FtsN [Lentibacillus sp. CBA3610]